VKFEVYCDESQPDALWSKSRRRAKYLLIGGLWIPARGRDKVKTAIAKLKAEHGFPHEIKWHKVHEDKAGLYRGLVDLFIGLGDDARFRCVVVEARKVNLDRFHRGDRELGFYKFYYQMLLHWVVGDNQYRVFCDIKTCRVSNQLAEIRRILNRVAVSATVESIQALPSHEVELLQFADFLLGMASSRMNESVKPDTFKDKLIRHLERKLGRARLKPTGPFEQKYNIFSMNLDRGW
jgi:hypothetical protein